MIKNIFYGFLRVHILYHAVKEKICGIEIIREISNHGYTLSPGTLYPLLHRMEKDGLLIKNDEVSFGRKRVYYKATKKGEKEFQEIKMKVVELYKEVVEGSK